MCNRCKNGFMHLYEKLSVLNEAKQDRINFINFFRSQGWNESNAINAVERFDKIRQILKSPENDYYYWIKKGDTDEVYAKIKEVETEQEIKKIDKSIIAAGAYEVDDTDHWKVYHITNYEAARVYGRDSKWCITGINNYGSKY